MANVHIRRTYQRLVWIQVINYNFIYHKENLFVFLVVFVLPYTLIPF